MKTIHTLFSLVLSVGMGAGLANAGMIDFNSLAHGEIVTNQFTASDGVTISAINPNRPHDLAIIFDSLETSTADPDLEGPPWTAGNLAPDTILANMLIIAENDVDLIDNTTGAPIPDGLIDNPDDEGNRPAGDLIFDYVRPITQFGFDLVDIESVALENGNVSFYLNGIFLHDVGFDDFVDALSPFYDPTVVYGNNSANRISPITAADLGVTGFDKVVISMGGSGAIDNIIPEPATMLLLASGGLMFTSRRRR